MYDGLSDVPTALYFNFNGPSCKWRTAYYKRA